jgi:type VI secretion system protein ImpA
LINSDELLEEVSADVPCGDDLEYDPKFGELERAAQGKPEQQFGDTIIPAEDPDWAAVERQATDLLSRTKDLRIAAHLTRAAARTDGWAGVSGGLELIRGLLERYWDCLHPQLDPSDNFDPTFRVNTISSLADRDAILDALRTAPLIQSQVLGRVSLRDVQIASGELPQLGGEGGESPDQQTIDAAFREIDNEQLRGSCAAIRTSIDCVGAIESLLMERVGPTEAPDLGPLNDLLKAADKVLRARLAEHGEGFAEDGLAEAVDQEAVAGAPMVGGADAAAPPGTIASREDVIRVLDQVCRYYERCEPSSPVPVLIQRAKRLVAKDFMEIVRDLAPDGLSQVEFIRGVEPESE